MTDSSTFIQEDAYSLADYGSMVADQVRRDAYVEALRRTVKPGSVVLDIGTGAGTFALLACELGARRVVAVEPSDVIEVAQELASANGFADRIEFIKGASGDVKMSEPADVIVSDLRGALPLYRKHIPSLVDARHRLLAPGGWLMPWKDTVWGTVVEDQAGYGRYVAVWKDALPELDTRIAHELATNTWWKTRSDENQVLADPQIWATLDYHTIEATNVSERVEWTITKAGTGHGLCLWFDAELTEGVSFSGAPAQPALIYGHAFFPFSEPVALSLGDMVETTITASFIGGDYVWRWETQVSKAEGSDVVASFDQSTLHGTLMSPARVRRTMATHAPTLSDEGRLMHFTLERMAAGVTLQKIAEELMAKFAQRFQTWDEAFGYAARLSSKYCE